MNYRHAYHAGNFADVLKHAVLALVIEHMKLKAAPFRVIDTHAGVGLYDLGAEAAQKTGEWREGIARVMDASFPPAAAAALAPYLDVVRQLNAAGGLRRCPGSPYLARALLRDGDRLIVNELHPEDQHALKQLFARDRQVKVMALDAWTAVKALLPPPERRGIVLIDPAFEQPGELERLVDALEEGARRFATGTFLLWYPIKESRPVAAFRRKVAALGLPKALAVELTIRRRDDEEGRLGGAGLVIVNAPFTLAANLETLMPELARVLAQGDAAWRMEELGAEAAKGARRSPS
jgi:23S rRNA (adenine2030-N6)-methyltransferase